MLEEYLYKIEVCEGVDYVNVDGMLCGCYEKECICDKFERYERRYDIYVG